MCAVFVSSFPLTHCVRLRSSVRLVPLLVASSRVASRLYSLRFTRRLVWFINSPAARCVVSSGGPVPRLVHCSSVFRLARFIVSRLVFPSRPLVSSSSPYSLVSPGGSSRRFVVSGRVLSVSRLILFCSRIISLVAVSWPWGWAAARHLRFRIVAACSPPVAPSWNPIG